MAPAHLTLFRLAARCAALVSLLLPVGTDASSVAAPQPSPLASPPSQVGAREVVIGYRAHTGD